MAKFTSEQLDTPLAELEIYGLSYRTCGLLEEGFGLLYVKDLGTVTEKKLLEGRLIGMGVVEEIRRALGNFLAGKPVKTVDECVEF